MKVTVALVMCFAIVTAGHRDALAAGCDPRGSDIIGAKFAYALQSNYSAIDGVRASLLEYRP